MSGWEEMLGELVDGTGDPGCLGFHEHIVLDTEFGTTDYSEGSTGLGGRVNT